MPVPLLDLQAQYHHIKEEVDAAVADVFATQRFIGGPHVTGLENELARYTGAPHAMAVASGTDALLLALQAAGIGREDEVIVPAFTFFATAGAVHNCGAVPVFADIEPDTFNIAPASIEKAITTRTKAIVPVHLFGQHADMGAIMDIAQCHGLAVIEDAAQALGSLQHNESIGVHGDAAAISFFPSKNLGGAGDGGMILTGNADLAARVGLLRNHGQGSTYMHTIVGTNSRLDALQAAVLRIKLRYLDTWAEERRAHAFYYNENFLDIGGITPPMEKPGNRHVFNQYTIRIPRRDGALALLRKKEIGCSVYYPLPLHLQECFRHLGGQPGDHPVAEQASREVMSLPVYPELTKAQQDAVIQAIGEHMASN